MITREKGTSDVVFHCDGCSEMFNSETNDFTKALDKLKAERWGMQKEGGEWEHYCEACWTEPDDDDEEDI